MKLINGLMPKEDIKVSFDRRLDAFIKARDSLKQSIENTKSALGDKEKALSIGSMPETLIAQCKKDIKMMRKENEDCVEKLGTVEKEIATMEDLAEY